MTPRLRLGLVGAGRVASAYLDAVGSLQLLGRVELVGIADTDPAARLRSQQRAACPTYSSHETLVEASRPDAMILCTPPAEHLEIALFLLARGIPVLSEKPLGLCEAEATRMLACAEDNGTVLALASKFRHSPDVARACALVESGRFGVVRSAAVVFESQLDLSGRWNADPEISGGGVLIDNGPHAIDLLQLFLGELDTITVDRIDFHSAGGVEDRISVAVGSRSGAQGSLRLSWRDQSSGEPYLRLRGEQASLELGWQGSRWRTHEDAEWLALGPGYDRQRAFEGVLVDFLDAVAHKRPCAMDRTAMLTTVRLIDAAYRSLEERPPACEALAPCA